MKPSCLNRMVKWIYTPLWVKSLICVVSLEQPHYDQHCYYWDLWYNRTFLYVHMTHARKIVWFLLYIVFGMKRDAMYYTAVLLSHHIVCSHARQDWATMHYVGKALRRLSAWDPGCGGPSTPIRVGHPWAAARCAALVQRFSQWPVKKFFFSNRCKSQNKHQNWILQLETNKSSGRTTEFHRV